MVRKVFTVCCVRAFFSEEKKQKTFTSLSRTFLQHQPKEIEVFWFFFSKKNFLLLKASQMTDTMRAIRYLGPAQDFQLRAVAIPQPAPGQVRVRIAACGMCRTELHLRDGLLDLGARDFTVGHEIAGTIEKLGEGVSPIRLGERVLIYYYEGCGDCRYCRSGDQQLCPQPKSQPGFTTDGGYAEYVVVRAQNCVKVPDAVPLAHIAPMGCAGSTAVHAGKMARIVPGEWVVVHGVGGVGLALMQYAKSAGGRVIAVDLGVEKIALARKLGADAAIDAATEADIPAKIAAITGEGADVVFELVGTTETMRRSAAMLRRRGRMVMIGYTSQNFEIHPVELIVRELTVIGSVGSTLQDLHDIVDLVAAGVITPIIDRVIPLESFAEGLEAVEGQATLGRIVLTMA
jgi:propanol-preferring alcohol dehydrogenase